MRESPFDSMDDGRIRGAIKVTLPFRTDVSSVDAPGRKSRGFVGTRTAEQNRSLSDLKQQHQWRNMHRGKHPRQRPVHRLTTTGARARSALPSSSETDCQSTKIPYNEIVIFSTTKPTIKTMLIFYPAMIANLSINLMALTLGGIVPIHADIMTPPTEASSRLLACGGGGAGAYRKPPRPDHLHNTSEQSSTPVNPTGPQTKTPLQHP